MAAFPQNPGVVGFAKWRIGIVALRGGAWGGNGGEDGGNCTRGIF